MRNMRRNLIASGLLAIASQASAQVASVCRGDACFKLNIPQSTADSGDGDIFFQISAPSDWEWVALGQGSGMANSNMFIVYTSGDNNVTLSPRTASGYTMPNFNGDAQVTLLEGSGISDGKMVANVRCSNCNSWSGGNADFKAESGDFIYAYHSSGGPKNSDSTSASISQHDNQESFSWNWGSGKGGSSVNPLLNAQPSGSGSTPGATSCIQRDAQTATSTAPSSTQTSDDDSDDDSTSTQQRPPWATGTAAPTNRPFGPPRDKRAEKRQNLPYCDDVSDGSGFTALRGGPPANTTKMLIAHGVLASLAFVIFFPAGAIAIRLASFPGVVWFHAVFQAFAYLVYIAAFGLGVYLANGMNLLDSYHPIIGIVVFVCLFFQPILGFLHHALFKKYQSRTFWSYGHLWLGRIVITLGIINGGLGMKLASTMNLSSRSGMIAYGVIAGLVWLAWVASIVIGEKRRGSRSADRPPKYAESPRMTERARDSERDSVERPDVPHPDHGHYAPAR